MSEQYQLLVDQLMREGMTEEDALACADREFDVVATKPSVYIGTFAWQFARVEGEKTLHP
jgi:hypothetical protein